MDNDLGNIVYKIYWTKGYETGVEAERARILKALKQKAESRDILESLNYPFLLQELEQTILQDQDD